MSEDNNLIKQWGNDAKRQAFLKAYREWGLWFTTLELGLTWYRYILPDGTMIIAMEYEHEVFAGYHSGTQEKYKLETTVRFYLKNKDKPFSPSFHSSISTVAERLKSAKVSMMNEAKK